MRMVLFIALALFLFVNVQPATATSPCIPQTAEEFQAVKDDSELIVDVQVIGSFYKKTNEQSITWVRILNTYKGKADSDVMKVRWMSINPPLYSYEADSEVVLLLKQKDGNW